MSCQALRLTTGYTNLFHQRKGQLLTSLRETLASDMTCCEILHLRYLMATGIPFGASKFNHDNLDKVLKQRT
jgi:hypothetical protein